MTDKNRVFGMPSIPRHTMPSMFQILGWYSDPQPASSSPVVSTETPQNQAQPSVEPDRAQEDTDKNAPIVNSKLQRQQKREGRCISMTKSGVYERQQVCLRRSSSQQKCETTSSKVVLNTKIEPIKKVLDPSDLTDAKEIQERRKRIKRFQYVTRDLSNSAFTTYFGKPAWQAYGRCSSNPKHLTHNVMPHRGDNHPKNTQSYYSALIKAKNKTLSNYIPRKPIQQRLPIPPPQEQVKPINLHTEVPDLINHVRFALAASRKSQDNKIPSNKVGSVSAKSAKRGSKKQRKKRAIKTKEDDGLKYMNNRENLLKILESKRANKSKLAWKVTECYPFDISNQEQLKKSTLIWEKMPLAGVETQKGQAVKDLIESRNKHGQI